MLQAKEGEATHLLAQLVDGRRVAVEVPRIAAVLLLRLCGHLRLQLGVRLVELVAARQGLRLLGRGSA